MGLLFYPFLWIWLFSFSDQNGDQILTEDEFSSLHMEGDGEKSGETINQGEADRRAEFRAEIDKNKDGKADRRELLVPVCFLKTTSLA